MNRPNIAWIAAMLLTAGHVGVQAQAKGKLDCEIMENGEKSSGTVTLRKGDEVVWSGSCTPDLRVPTGELSAVLSLDGALDGPQKTQPVKISGGKAASLKADFATGTLVVKIDSKGRMAAGMAIIRRDGKQIGTLGSGVEAHLSEGSYEVVARYRREEKSFSAVKIEAGQRKTLSASFGATKAP